MRRLYRILFTYVILGQIYLVIALENHFPFLLGCFIWIIIAFFTDKVVAPFVLKGLLKKIEICIIRKVFTSSSNKKGNSSAKQPTSNSSTKTKRTSQKIKENKSSKQVKKQSSSKK